MKAFTDRAHVHPAAVNLTGGIGEPGNEDEAKFSPALTAATAPAGGNSTLQDPDAATRCDETARELASKVHIIGETLPESRASNIRGAWVELVMGEGTSRSETVQFPGAEPDAPVTFEDIAVKMRSCADSVFPEDRLQAIAGTVKKPDRPENIDPLPSLLVL